MKNEATIEDLDISFISVFGEKLIDRDIGVLEDKDIYFARGNKFKKVRYSSRLAYEKGVTSSQNMG